MSSIVFYVLVLVLLIVLASVYLAHRRQQNWRRFAAKYRFRYSKGKWWNHPVVSGEIQGRAFQLAKAETSSDTGLVGVELVEMSFALLGGLPRGLEVSKGFASLTGEMPESSIETGEEEFDATSLVRGESQEQVLAYLKPERREALLDLLRFKSADWAGVRDRRVVLIERRMVSSFPDLEKRFHFLFDIARRLDA